MLLFLGKSIVIIILFIQTRRFRPTSVMFYNVRSKLYEARGRVYHILKYLFVCLFFNRYFACSVPENNVKHVYIKTEASRSLLKTIFFVSTFSEL